MPSGAKNGGGGTVSPPQVNKLESGKPYGTGLSALSRGALDPVEAESRRPDPAQVARLVHDKQVFLTNRMDPSYSHFHPGHPVWNEHLDPTFLCRLSESSGRERQNTADKKVCDPHPPDPTLSCVG